MSTAECASSSRKCPCWQIVGGIFYIKSTWKQNYVSKPWNHPGLNNLVLLQNKVCSSHIAAKERARSSQQMSSPSPNLSSSSSESSRFSPGSPSGSPVRPSISSSSASLTPSRVGSGASPPSDSNLKRSEWREYTQIPAGYNRWKRRPKIYNLDRFSRFGTFLSIPGRHTHTHTHIYIYIYLYMYVYVYIHMCVYVMHFDVYIAIYIYIYYKYVYLCKQCVYIYIHIYLYCHKLKITPFVCLMQKSNKPNHLLPNYVFWKGNGSFQGTK